MVKNKSPLVFVRWESDKSIDPHALLAYKYSGDVITYYDPNYPGQSRSFTENMFNKKEIDYAHLKYFLARLFHRPSFFL